MGDELLELPADIAANSDDMLTEGVELGISALEETTGIVGETAEEVAQASQSSAGAIAGEAITVAEKVLGAAEEVHNVAQKVDEMQDTFHKNLEATLNSADPVHQSIEESRVASRKALDNEEITTAQHKANVDQLIQENLNLSAATNEQIEGAVLSNIAGITATAASGFARGMAKAVSPLAEVTSIPIAGEAILEAVGLPKSIE